TGAAYPKGLVIISQRFYRKLADIGTKQRVGLAKRLFLPVPGSATMMALVLKLGAWILPFLKAGVLTRSQVPRPTLGAKP
ncbi:MAG: hypothetical protein OEQ39_28680, partial [Gammaproteobacteria bacterium]|nr:hypothetical protein [Gammaproteobacteria bacterium]